MSSIKEVYDLNPPADSPEPGWDWSRWPTDNPTSRVREIFYNNGNTVDWDHVSKLSALSAREGVLYLCGLNPDAHPASLPLGRAMRRHEVLAEDFFARVAKLVAQAESVKNEGWTHAQLVTWAEKSDHPIHREFRALAKPTLKVRQELLIPGKLPRSQVAQLAVKVAYQLEQNTKRPATYIEVMNRLHDFVENGEEVGILVSSNRKENVVEWSTVRNGVASYTANACKKSLAAWRKSMT